MYDYLIIGAGIIGTTIARELSRYKLKACVLEKENDVANVQTLANSAIIHSGHNPKPGSLRAKLNILGNELYNEMEKNLQIPLLHCGAFVIAHGPEEEKQLEELYEIAKHNGVPEFAILDYEEAIKTEPNLADDVTKVLTLPTTKVTYPWEVAFACMENAIANGVDLHKNSEVTAIEYVNNHFKVTVNNKKIYETLAIINASGVNTDDIAKMIESSPEFSIIPRKGEYFVLDKRVKGFVNHILYPLPTDLGKGVLLTPQYHGNILIGPNSEIVEDKHHVDTTFKGLDYVRENASHLAKNIPMNKIIRSFAGIRASSTCEDFHIKESKEYKNLFHLAGIDSPGLTAAPAIAKYLVEEVINVAEKFDFNPDFNPKREKQIEFHSLPKSQMEILLKDNPTYGNIICKCEKITEKEIVDAIQGALGSDTIKGIKKRVRAGAGLCQGGYCEEKVMKIIARELRKTPLDIEYDLPGSNLFVAETKVKK